MKIISKATSPELHNGFYLYKNDAYVNRMDIFDRMYAENDFGGSIRFYFNDHIFNEIDWTIEPPFSLPQLYRMRAQQLRESYDYLILAFSGGSDSMEVLHTFIENGIFLDEVQVINYEKAISKIDETTLYADKSLAHFLEFRLSVIPELEYIKQKSPNTKISVYDISDDFMKHSATKGVSPDNLNPRTVLTNCPTMTYPWTQLSNLLHNETALTKNNKVAFISGNEKPQTTIADNKFYFFFGDWCYYNSKMHNDKFIDRIFTNEEFFWSKDAPLIPVKQSHVLKRALETDPVFYKKYTDNEQTKKISVGKKYGGVNPFFERELCKFIYAYWNKINLPKIGIAKPEITLANTLTGKTFLADSADEWNRNILKKYSKIPPRYLNKIITSKHHFIGNICHERV